MNMDKLYGVYNADGGIIGELSYVIGKIRGKVHCALCDITHKGISKKKEWKSLERKIDIPFELVHLNEQKKEFEEYTAGKSPCVVGEKNGDLVYSVNCVRNSQKLIVTCNENGCLKN